MIVAATISTCINAIRSTKSSAIAKQPRDAPHYYASDRRKGDNTRCFCPPVPPSVCLSVPYTANNSTTQRPSVPKFGRKVPHLRCESHITFNVKRLGAGGDTMSAEPGGHSACYTINATLVCVLQSLKRFFVSS